MKSEQQRAFLAVIISGVILFVWQFYIAPQESQQASQAATAKTTQEQETTAPIEPGPSKAAPSAPIANIQEQEFTLSNKANSYTVTNYLNVSEATYEGVSAAKEIFENAKPVSIKFLVAQQSSNVKFNVSQKDSTSIAGASDEFGLSFTAKLNERGQLSFLFTKSESSPVTSYSTVFRTSEKSKNSFSQRVYAWATTDLEYIEAGEAESETASIYWQGMDFDYYLFAATFGEKKDASLKAYEKSFGEHFESFIKFDSNKANINLLFTKKEYDRLSDIGENLHLSVDFGIFSFLAIPLLRGLQFFYSIFPNYGIAIILLTIIIRFLVFPLQYKSTVSMKKMQVIQPELKKIQEKFKDDPQRLQKESMALFKRSGAHPLSGCFPLLLQMPVFFALYKVLYNSVELVGAPFYFWITDLSTKDPFYILPVLMSIFMFLQQKMTPTASADPMQKKIFLFMPLIFGFIMKDFPSGLNLYILISTVFALLQQYFVLKRVSV